MFKVITPIEKHNGEKYWMRLGSAFTNKDDSINVYLDAIPTGKDWTLQLRELTEEDLRPRGERNPQRAAFNLPANAPPPALSLSTNPDLPF
jgi:hypothetical protein